MIADRVEQLPEISIVPENSGKFLNITSDIGYIHTGNQHSTVPVEFALPFPHNYRGLSGSVSTETELSMDGVDPQVGLGRGSDKFPKINRC